MYAIIGIAGAIALLIVVGFNVFIRLFMGLMGIVREHPVLMGFAAVAVIALLIATIKFKKGY